MILLGLRAVAAFPKNGILKIYYVPGHTTLSLKGKIQYPHYPHIPQQSYTAKPSGTAAQFHSTFRSGNPDNPTSIASHITVSSYTAALSQCHFRSIIQSIPHTLQHQEISTFRSVTHALVVSQQTHVYFYYIQKAVKFNVDFYSFCRYHVAYLRLILSESESCVTGAEMTKKNSNRATLRYYSLLLSG